MITFDPINRRIVLDSTTVSAGDIYSRWKDWVKSGNAFYPQAFSVVGGDPLGGGLYVASYFFLENGWKIRPMEQNQLLIIEGNLSSADGSQPVVSTLGNYNVSVQYTVPVQAQGIATSGTSGPTSAEIAAAVVSALASQIAKLDALNVSNGAADSNIRYVNNIPVSGYGTDTSPWGPA